MPTDSQSDGEKRQTMKSVGVQQQQPHQSEPDNLPCPRCESTNTKFCYYNNYNLSQPRYFCKACRRYWTRGGTLRNVPVGGGSRKNSKRSRSSSSSTSSSSTTITAIPNVNPPPMTMNPQSLSSVMMTSPPDDVMMMKAENHHHHHDLNLNEASFTSLLTANNVPALQGGSAFLGYGLGLGFEDMGLGFGYGPTETQEGENHHHNNGANSNGSGHVSWHHHEHLGGYEYDHGHGGKTGNNVGNGGNGGDVVMDGRDYFGWPDLAISTAHGKGE